ncbi:unnamed protein product [Adineta ricciae]|uniref:F-box domain-containing protein n=1 Tax=Adineta ricciae TaxID=249248 RepID=A0A814Q9F7_ADIRI|nr:unnamed protein product [Adineta ricciae]CAF1263652.1 unnamed protein product [Adineta ricciae]
MDPTKAEQLPDELWLMIFHYLEIIDVLLTFKVLNQRFQQMIKPYYNHIDLADASSKQFNAFINEILLSKENHPIRSLTLKNSGQFKKIFYSKEHTFTRLQHIEALQLTIDHWFHEHDLLNITLPHLSHLSNLTSLHLNILPDTYMKDSFRPVFEYFSFPSTLVKLTILGFWKQMMKGYTTLNWFRLPSNIRSFAFAIDNLKTIYKTNFLQEANNHIEDLKIAFKEMNDFDAKYSNLNFSTSLVSLHLEMPLITMEFLPRLLNLFSKEIKSLILILRVSFEVDLNLIISIKDLFPSLEIFQYVIYSPNQIITNTADHIVSPFHDINKFAWKRYINNLNYDNLSTDFIKLHKLTYGLSSESFDLTHDNINTLNQLIVLLPNLKALKLNGNNSQTIIEVLKLLCTKRLTKFHFNTSKFHHSFLIDLAQIIPHVRELRLEDIHFSKYHADYSINRKIYRKVLTATVAIEHVQRYYKELMDLYLYMLPFNYTDKEMCKANQQLQEWLNGAKQQDGFYSIYTIHQNYYQSFLSNYDSDIYQKSFPYCLYVSP